MNRRKPPQMIRNIGNRQPGRHANRLEALWEDLLSSQPEIVRAAYASLDASQQKAILAHLERMVSEPGWQPEQRRSARAAIQALENQAR